MEKRMIINETKVNYNNGKMMTGVLNTHLYNAIEYMNIIDIYFKCSKYALEKKCECGSIFLPTTLNKIFVELRWEIDMNKDIKVEHIINVVKIKNEDNIPTYNNITQTNKIHAQHAYLNAKNKEGIFGYYCKKLTDIRIALNDAKEKQDKEEKRKKEKEQFYKNLENDKIIRKNLKLKMDKLFEDAQKRENKQIK